MSQLRFGNVTLEGEVFQTRSRVGERSVPALEIRLEGAADETVLRAMTEHDLEIEDSGGILQGRESGYRTLVRHSVVLARVSEAEEELARSNALLRAAQRESVRLEEENARLLYTLLTGEEG